MKSNVIVLLAAIFLCNSVNAQFKLGVTGGVVLCTPDVSGITDKNNFSTPSFGIIAQADLGPVAFRPSINYLRNGYKTVLTSINLPGLTTTTNNEVVINNIEVPLDVVLPVKTKKGKLLISLAPTVTLGLNGKYTIENYLNNNLIGTSKGDVEFGEDAAEVKKVDWGSRLGIGYEFSNGLQLNAAYKLGMSNQSNQNNQTYKNHYVALSAAWFLFK
jgi:Outer membrane protein beta-barrel domain